MAEQTFTVGQVLTAAQMTTLQANTGLNFITSATISTTTTSINNCFTTAYTNYRVVITTSQVTADQSVSFRFRAGGADNVGANYNYGYTTVTTAGATSVGSGTGSNNFLMGFIGLANGTTQTILDICGPQTNTRTTATMQRMEYDSVTFNSRQGALMKDAVEQYDGLSYIFGGAATGAGTIQVFGYRNS